MNRASLRPPLTAAFQDGPGWRLCGTPASTLLVQQGNETGLTRLPDQVEEWLQTRPRGLAVGIVAYEAAGALHHPGCAHPAATPLAVIHLFEDAPCVARLPQPVTPFHLRQAFSPDWRREDYLAAVEQIRHWLRAGDCYQVNLAQRFSSQFEGDPWSAWLRLQARHAAPHACYFDYGEGQVFGVSPERFLAINGRQVVTEPIKGSQPRGTTREEDAALGERLRNSSKDRAENLMIVDLLRNDLGALCEPGSIHAHPLFELRRFSNVQHLVSTVRGTLREDLSPLAALLACFPGGSITGAPKRRAMEVIRELEPVPRGFYCGTLFWQTGDGRFDSSILIRTLQASHGTIVCHGGGGIVYDSVPEQEYAESLFKVEKLMAALDQE